MLLQCPYLTASEKKILALRTLNLFCTFFPVRGCFPEKDEKVVKYKMKNEKSFYDVFGSGTHNRLQFTLAGGWTRWSICQKFSLHSKIGTHFPPAGNEKYSFGEIKCCRELQMEIFFAWNIPITKHANKSSAILNL